MHEHEIRLAAKIGAAIREQRQLRGLSQEAFAERVELSSHFIGLVERGKELPSLTTLLLIARTFGVDLDALLAGADDLAPPAWERQALALLATVPADFRPAVLAMLRALAKASRQSYAHEPVATHALADGRTAKRPRPERRKR